MTTNLELAFSKARRVSENEAHYRALLDAVASSGAWFPLPRELVRWWRTRTMTPLEQVEGSEGMSFGTAVLDSSGRVQIVPPVRW